MSFLQKLTDLSSLKSLQQEIQEAPAGDEKLKALKRFHDAFTARTAVVREALETHEQRQQAAMTSAEEEATKAEEEVAQLEAELAQLEAEEAANDHPLAAAPGVEYRDFLEKRADVIAHLHVIRDTLLYLVSGSSLKMDSVADREQFSGKGLQDKWANVTQQVEELEAMANVVEASGSFGQVDRSLVPVQTLLTESQNLAAAAESTIQAHQQKQDALRDGIKEFETERKRLLLWCRQQKTNLDAMSQPEHVQEFCASLLNNFSTMEENFVVLLEVAEPLLPHSDVQQALIETNEVWFNLQVSAYERLRHTLLEIHPKSKLEDEVREFSNYSRKVHEFLNQFAELLSAPSDPESQGYVRPVLDHCQQLQQMMQGHTSLHLQLKEFANRMESMRESYDGFRRAALSRLTFLANSAPTLAASMQRKEEYIARMKDLKKWIHVKAQGETWRDIHQRVVAIRELIEKERAALLKEAN